MKNLILFFTIIITLNSCGQNKSISQSTKAGNHHSLVDTMLIAVIPYDTSFHYLTSFKGYKAADVNESDIHIIDSLLNLAISNYNVSQRNNIKLPELAHPNDSIISSDILIDLQKYKRQYIVALNNNGEKLVWINCFCEGEIDNITRKYPYVVMDGGKCYFNIMINITKKKYFNLMVNGEA